MADVLDLGGVVGEVALDDAVFQRVWTRVMGQMRQFGAEAAKAAQGQVRLDEAMAQAGTAGTKAAAGTDKLTAAERRAAAQAAALADAKARLAALDTQLAGLSSRQQQLVLRAAAAQERANLAAGQGSQAYARLASAEASASAAADRLAASQEATVASSGRMGSGVLATAKQLGILVGAFEAVKAVIDIGKESASYERSMKQISALTGADEKQIAGLNGQLLAMSKQYAQAPEDLATSLYHAYAIGLKGKDALDLVAAAAKGAAVGNANLEDTTNALTSTVAAGVVGNQSYTKTMAQLLQIVGSGDMKLSQFNEALGTGGIAQLATYGVTLRDIGAALATFGDNNLRGANAMTRLIQTARYMEHVVGPGAQALDAIGLSTERLTGDLQKGGLNRALQDLHNHLDAAGITGNKVGAELNKIFSARGAAGVAMMLQDLDRFDTKYRETGDDAQTLDQRFNKIKGTASFAFKAMTAGAVSAGVEFEQRFNPQIAAAAHLIATAIPEAADIGKGALAPFVAGWRALDDVLGPVVHGLDDVAHDLGPVAPVLKGTASAVLALWLAFKGYTLARAAILAIGSAAETGYLKTLMMRDGIVSSTGPIQAAYGRIGQSATLAGLQQKAAADDASAAQARSAAVTAQAFSDETAASRAATDEQVADADARATAAMAAARAAAVAASESAAAAGTAAAEIDTAGAAARIGWSSMLGPIGLAAVGITALIPLFHHSGQSAQDAAAQVSTYTDAIKADSGALADNTREAVRNALEKSGAAAAGEKLGISYKLITDAVLGVPGALARVNAELLPYSFGVVGATKDTHGQVAAAKLLSATLGDQSSAVHKAADLYNYETGKTKDNTAATGSNTVAHKEAATVLGWLVTSHGNLVQAEHKAGSALADGTAAMQAQTRASTLLGNALGILNGVAESVETSTDSFNIALLQLKNGSALAKDSNNDLIKSLSRSSVAGNQNRQTLVSLIDAAKAQAQAVADNVAKRKGETAGLLAGNKALKSNEDRIRAAAQAAGLDTKQVDGLIASIGKLSHVKAAPKVSVDTSAARSAIAQLHAWLNGLHNKTITVTEYSHLMQQTGHGNISGRASGGGLPKGLAWVGERGAELADNDGHGNVQIIPHGVAMAYAHAAGLNVPGFAGGTSDAAATIAEAIYRATRPAPTAVGGLRAETSQHIGGATTRQAAATTGLAAYRQLAVQLKEVTKATDAQVAAAKHEAVQATIAATKAQNLAEKMPTATKAEKKAKAAAEDHAKALQHEADVAGNVATKTENAAQRKQKAAQNAADRAKKAYEKEAAASKAATAVVVQNAQAVVSALQSQYDTLQQNVSDLEGSISSSLTGGSDLSTIWGQFGSAVQTASSNLDQAKQAMQSATVDSGALAAAQQSAAQATADQAAAHQALTAALAGGNASAILAAQQAQTDASTRLAAAQTAVTAATPTADQLTAQATAQDQLTAAQQAYNQAVSGQSASGVASVLGQFAGNEQQFADHLNTLAKMGAGQALITQLAGLGDQAGDALAQGLINDPASLKAIQSSMDSISNIAGQEGDTLATDFLGAGVTSMQQLLAGIEKQFPETKAALSPLAADLAAMFVFTPTVSTPASKSRTLGRNESISDLAAGYGVSVGTIEALNPSWGGKAGSTVIKKGAQITVPKFATGTPDFAAGGPAWVAENGPELIDFPQHARITPLSNVSKGSSPFADITPLVQRLDRIEARLAEAPALTGAEVARSGAGLYDRAGRTQADRMRRAVRTGAY